MSTVADNLSTTPTEAFVEQPQNFGLGDVPSPAQYDNTTNVVCGYCSTGCGLNVHLKNSQAIGLSPTQDYPVNLGMACPKGWEALTPLYSNDRATKPLLRNANGKLEAVDWDMAMQVFTLRLKAIQDKNGKDSVAWLGTGQIVTEEMAYLGALAKFGMGIVHGDSNTRQCMATSAVAYKQSFGFDAPPYTYKDFEESDVLIFIGSNLCIAHPILWQRVLRNPHQPEIVVIDPRKTETAMGATQHYAIQPKSDLTFLYGIAKLLIENGWIDPSYISEHTNAYEAFVAFVQPFSSQMVAAASGISAERLLQLARLIGEGKRVSFWWTMGVNQGHESTRTAQAIINLALMTGNMGRPGTGANSVTGQCNAMGSRLFSNTSNLLGGRDFLNAADREQVARILHLDPALIPDQNSWTYDQIVSGIENDKIKGLWIIATNSSHSWIHQNDFNKLLQKLDFLVVQDIYHTTETAQHADLFLPAAAWGEKEGTFINSERRFGLVKRVSKSPGEALSDFNIFKLIGHYWGCAHLFSHWTSPERVFQILKELSRGQPCDFSGIEDYRAIDEAGGIQWPFTESSKFEVQSLKFEEASAQDNLKPQTSNFKLRQERRLFEDGKFFHTDGKARFIFEQPRPMPEPPCQQFPFVLMTGRGTSAQWHTQTRTGKSEILRRLYPANIYVELNPADAERLQIGPNDRVQISSRRGRVEAYAFITYTIQSGQAFIPMHYPAVNRLTFPAFDPYSRQPSYKACAVDISRLDRKPKPRS
ncbi:MAG: narB 2 [Verrucomicrobiales bacterium]|nr:narB 2 [Verrucomicrobiales bacterium]